MTDAYIKGFCKTAEAYGVEPEALIKYAQLKGLLGALTRAPKRYIQLLEGGNAAARNWTKNFYNPLLQEGADHLKETGHPIKAFLTKLLGRASLPKAQLAEIFGNRKLRNEFYKVYGTRAGTAFGGGMALNKLFPIGTGKSKQQETDKSK